MACIKNGAAVCWTITIFLFLSFDIVQKQVLEFIYVNMGYMLVFATFVRFLWNKPSSPSHGAMNQEESDATVESISDESDFDEQNIEEGQSSFVDERRDSNEMASPVEVVANDNNETECETRLIDIDSTDATQPTNDQANNQGTTSAGL